MKKIIINIDKVIQKITAEEEQSTLVKESPNGPVLHRQLTVIEVAEAETLEMLQADRRISPFIVAKLSDCVALVAANKANQIIKQLLKAGHTPKIIDM